MPAEPPPPSAESPLTPAELAQLEATLLPALERHHLRLLAHGLRTLQAIAQAEAGGHGAAPGDGGALPHRGAISAWARQQPQIADDGPFQAALVVQLEAAGRQLAHLADGLGKAPLSLELADLAAWATRQADQRLGSRDTHRP